MTAHWHTNTSTSEQTEHSISGKEQGNYWFFTHPVVHRFIDCGICNW